MITSHSARRV